MQSRVWTVLDVPIPNQNALFGADLHVQALVFHGPRLEDARLTNRATDRVIR
ncbi:MAG: hypothetical protein H6832_18935 [Planctomycetes bacterium]|nr:hypothetical protein [Planctomycetota bacterium]MCB9920486.1 hypothetical protein [Planctomycetota bacterium]